ncbi:MAG: tetraacyldisaccharide 4'-kinase [Paracoccaceae bacterium]|jgi:tetraacyldisaccharide 4'-kinase
MRAPEFWRHNGLLPVLLSPASAIWRHRAASRIRQASPQKVSVPVICIGNAVAGGAGKTPVAMSVADTLLRQGIKPHFLSRGYGGTTIEPTRVDPAHHSAHDVGDEPLLLARHAPTWVAHNRVAGAKIAVSAGAEIIVLDDGLQNPSLHKDISILVVDGGYGFGNRRVMPAGPLREDLNEVIARVDAVAIIGTDRHGIEQSLQSRKPVLAARFVPRVEDDDLSGRAVLAFAGIGRPQKFFETLAGMGCDVVATRAFADHHPYTSDEVMRLLEDAAAAGAIAVTTEKDAVRLPAETRDIVRTLGVTLEWRDQSSLDTLLSSALSPALTAKA